MYFLFSETVPEVSIQFHFIKFLCIRLFY